MALLNDEHRRWIGHEDPPVTVEVSRRDIVKYAIATEQRLPKYLRGDEAPPMFVFNLFGALSPLEGLRPDGLPRGQRDGPALPLKRVMAGGTELIQHRAIRPGDRLTASSRLTDLYEKSGAQGPLIFSVRTMRVVDASGAPVLEEIQTAIAR
ncbi:MAG TPA: MaoC family dehydratase N-terminal domain-containing protein [Myxococcota bacterium]|jgi:3-methylfumaryl-CoA hydratase